MPLTITVPAHSIYDEAHKVLIPREPVTLVIEHSLLSIALWEERWHIPFFSESHEKTTEMLNDYIRCMTLNGPISDERIIQGLSPLTISQINEYINDPHTATTVNNNKHGKKRVMTSELIYSYMFRLQIPIECERWHINRLLTEIAVMIEEQNPSGKMDPRTRKSLMEARRAKSHRHHK